MLCSWPALPVFNTFIPVTASAFYEYVQCEKGVVMMLSSDTKVDGG